VTRGLRANGRRRLVERRAPWLLLAASAVLPLVVAGWFQHVNGLDPCVMCIYERVALFGLIAAGLFGALAPGLALVRLVGYLLWGVSAAWGLHLVVRHVAMERDPQAAMACSFAADFPAWFKLDEWLPALFQPTGYCDDVQWRWLGLSMAEWAGVIFVLYLLALAFVLLLDLRSRAARTWV
jgi:disulfide bond formation protein DsbB